MNSIMLETNFVQKNNKTIPEKTLTYTVCLTAAFTWLAYKIIIVPLTEKFKATP